MPELMGLIREKGILPDAVTAILPQFDLQSLAQVGARPDLIPQIAAALIA